MVFVDGYCVVQLVVVGQVQVQCFGVCLVCLFVLLNVDSVVGVVQVIDVFGYWCQCQCEW